MKRFYGKKRENGAITVMTAFILIALVSFTALAVDFGLYYYKGAKLQNAADAAATAVAGNLGTVDTSLEEIAYEYLADNGFDKDAYGKDANGKNNLQVKIEKKGEVNLESADDERYINTGYYKVTVSTNETTIFGKVLDIDSLKLTKYSFVKADANYVAMPRALNYTVFAGSTQGTNSSPAIKVDGRTNKILNIATYFVERGINIINSSVVQPLIGFFGGTPNYGDLVAINLSEIVSNGDVHSNSNIGVGVQALNVSRMKDRDFEGSNNIEAYAQIELEEGEYEPGFSDYGQVTFTAVKDIRFNYLNNYADGQTRVYIQNQQYLEQTQACMNVLDLISDFESIDGNAALKNKYQEAAEIYIEHTFGLTDEQKAAIIAQKDNLEFMSRGNFKLKTQGSIVYYIHASKANDYLDYAEDKGVDGLVADLDNDKNDKMFKGDPENSSNGTLYNTAVDKADTTSTAYNFTKKNADNSVAQTMKLNVAGNSVSRNINNLSSVPANTLTGARFATAQTFQENSEYIEIPNLKPYFSRQVNRSIRNATKSRELINQSDAGQKNVKAAVAAKNDELLALVKNLSFEDNTYADSDEYTSYDKTVLFKTYKASPSSGITNLNSSDTISYTGKSRDTDNHEAYTYNVTMTDKTFKGKSLYNANNDLKTPTEFVNEYNALEGTANRNRADLAVQDRKKQIVDSSNVNSNGSNSERTAVDRKKSEVQNNNNYSYSFEKNSTANVNDVKDRIENPTVPDITHSGGDVTIPKINPPTLPNKKNIFLVKNDSSYVPTQYYNSAMSSWGATTSNSNGIWNRGTWGWNSGLSNSDTWQFDYQINYNSTAANFISAIDSYHPSWNTYAASAACNTTTGNKMILCSNTGGLAWDVYHRKGDYYKVIEKGDGTTGRWKNWRLAEQDKISTANGDDFYKVNGNWNTTGNGDDDIQKKGLYVGKSMRFRTTGYMYALGDKSLVLAQNAGVISDGTDSSGYAMKVDNNMDMASFSFAAAKGHVQVGASSKGEGNLTMQDGAIMFVDGNFTSKGNISMTSNNVLIVSGNLNAASISLGTSCKLVVRGTLTVNGHLVVPAGCVVAANNISITGSGHRIETAGVITAIGNLTVADGHEWFSLLQHGQSKTYVGGNLTCAQRVTLDGFKSGSDGCCLYVCGNVQASNTTGDSSSQATDALWVMNDSEVYIGGTFSSTNNSRNVWISPWTNGNNNTTSGQQNAVVSVKGGISNINAFNNEQSGANVYFDTAGLTTVGSSMYTRNYGNLYSFGPINLASNVVTLSNNGVTYCAGNFTASNADTTLNNAHLLYSTGTVTVKSLTLNDSSKVHADVKVVVSGQLSLPGSGTIVEGISDGITYGSQGTINGTINGKLSFAQSTISYSDLDGYVYTPAGGTATYSSFKLTRSKVKIVGNLVVNGDLELYATGSNSACILVVTGTIKVTGKIKLDYGNLYCENDIEAGSIEARDWSLLLARNGNDVNTVWTADVFVADLKVKNTIFADSSSKVYVEGDITTKGVQAYGGAQVLGYKSINITANYVNSNNQYESGFLVTGSNAEIFCGEQSTTGNEIGIVGSGILYYPNSSVICKYFKAESGSKFVFDGSDFGQNLLIKEWALVDTNGTFVNFGYTKVEGCRLTNRGLMYLIGGVNIDAANGSQDNEDFIFGDNSESYIGRYQQMYGSSLPTLNYKGFYLGRGQVYIENNLNIPSYTTNSNYKVGNRYTGIYVESGNTYVKGGVTVADGNGIFVQYNSGLIMNNTFTIGCTIYNYGRLHVIDGSLVLHNDATYITDVKEPNKDWNKNYKGISLRNGNQTEGVAIPADFFVGGTSSITFIGYVRNYGNIYVNSPLETRGYEAIDGIVGDVAYVNYAGAKSYINGAVKLNSNQLFNKWKLGDRETIFSCNGKLTFGGCLYNCGKLFASGAITNNESNSETVHNKSYKCDQPFSVLNGFYRIDNNLRDHLNDNIFPEAKIYSGGSLTLGVSEVGGESGSIISCGEMYIAGSCDIFTNGPRLKVGLSNIGDLFSNKQSHSYYRTGLWLFNNSNTFIGGDCFVGAGCAVARDSIFMVGGDLRTKRCAKLNVEMRVDYFLGLGVGGCYLTYTDDSTNYDNGNRYNTCYVYVGGNAFINTIGSTVNAATYTSILNIGQWPANNSRDMDIYANTNMYVGGALYANSKIYMKENVNIMVAGKGTGFYDGNGNLSTLILNNSGDLSVPEKAINKNSLSTFFNKVENGRKRNLNCKFYAYQSLDMSPCSKLIVNGGGHVEDTVKIRDMTKTYFYGHFEGREYVELGKALDGMDETEAKESGFIQAGDSVAKYKFKNSAYMYVGGDYESGKLNGFDVMQWLRNNFSSSGYTKVFASSVLKVKGKVTSNRYITLRHDAAIFAGDDLTAATSIEAGNYSEVYVGGDMTAGSSGFTKIIDALDILDISSRGTIDLRDQCQCIVGGNMFSTKHIQIGELASGSYTRGRGYHIVNTTTEGDDGTYSDSSFCPHCNQQLDESELENGHCNDCNTDFDVTSISEGGQGSYSDDDQPVRVCPKCGKELDDGEIFNAHCNDCNKDIDISAGNDHDGTSQGISDAVTLDTSSELDNENICPHCSNTLDREELEKSHCKNCNSDFVLNSPYGANVFIQGTMVALNGHIKEFAYSSVMVGKYVYAPDYVTLRSNSDMWIMPEMFGNETYTYLPYKGATPTNIWQRIAEWFKEKAYEFNETYKPKEGAIYTLGDLTVNYNASLMGTYDCYIPGKLIMRYDSLIYFGHDVSCYASTALSAIGGAVGNLKNLFTNSNDRQTYTGFDAQGVAGKGYRYTCKSKDPRHHGYWYNMTTRSDDPINGTLVCDVCGQPIDVSTKKEVQVSYPAVIYAFNDINIATTVDMQMTYLVADHGNVNLTNVYTATNWNETNLKELPNAIASYQGNINYFAMYGKLASLFYAPSDNINFDGYYSEIWGCVLGNTVEMNCYYQAFHRFNNWRTMDLRVAESGSVYLIPEKEFEEAPDNVDDDNYIENGVETPAHLFFNKKCPHCLKENIDKNHDNVCDECGYYLVCPYCHAAAKDVNQDDICDKCGEGILLPTPDFGLN